MANKKTFSVKKLVENTNMRLAKSICSDSERLAMCSVLETVLFETGNYAGYRYLDMADGSPYVSGVTNDSRREYYLYRGL